MLTLRCSMGKVLDLVRATVPLGDVIACTTPCSHLITAGVSNWGGYGLAAACAVLAEQAGAVGTHFAIPTRAEEESLFAAISSAGARCASFSTVVQP
jgi:hypothetical protein